MANDPYQNPGGNAPAGNFEQKLREAASHIEDDVRKLVGYINDEVMPDIRKNSSQALRSAAAELHRLAQRMEDTNRPTGTTTPGNPPPPRT